MHARTVGTIALTLLATGCVTPEPEPVEPSTPEHGASRLSVYTVSYPLAYFAERIGGDQVDVQFPAPVDVDPALWSPEAESVSGYQRADIILLNGAGYAAWVERVTLPASKLVDTSAGFGDRLIRVPNAIVHGHGPEGEHSHGRIAFTTWLDPTLAVEHARAIRNALKAARPDDRATFDAGFESLERDLKELDAGLRRVTAAGADTPLLASHPVYQYLEQRYGLNLRSVHFEPDAYPDEDGWRQLQEILVDHPARFMLWEGTPTEKTRRALAGLGVESVVYDPCGAVPPKGDFLTVMKDNSRSLERVFSP